jgi:hypothetical protein
VTEKDPTDPAPDADTTQRIEHQEVVDRYMSGWPETDEDKSTQPATQRRLFGRHRSRLAALAPALLIVVCATTACGPRFVDHSDHRYDPATPVHGAGLATGAP